jgi:hypothetical protein
MGGMLKTSENIDNIRVSEQFDRIFLTVPFLQRKMYPIDWTVAVFKTLCFGHAVLLKSLTSDR